MDELPAGAEVTPDGAPGAWDKLPELPWRLNIPSRFRSLRVTPLHAAEPVYATSRAHGLGLRLESKLPFVVYLDGERCQARPHPFNDVPKSQRRFNDVEKSIKRTGTRPATRKRSPAK